MAYEITRLSSDAYQFTMHPNPTGGSGTLYDMTAINQEPTPRYIVKFQQCHLAINEIFSQLIFSELGLPCLHTGIVVLASNETRQIPMEICKTGIPVAIEYIQNKSCQNKMKFPKIEKASLRKTMLQYILLDVMANHNDTGQMIVDESGRVYHIDCTEL
jgi:hypothetical protein